MLRSLDTLIGFVTVLLVLSLAVTMLTQIIANFLHLRSRHLREGVLDVFRQLGWGFVDDGAEILARKVVRSKDAITREDLIETLLVLAQKNTELKDKIAALAPDFDPQTLLAHVRRTALELSVERPDLAAAVVRATAFARSPLAGLASEVFGVFDSTMDRVSAKFTAQSRKLVAIAGIAVALALPLDTFDLLKRLARSDSAREQAVMLAQTFAENQSVTDPTPREVRLAAAKLQAAEVLVVPSNRAEWLARWQQVNWAGVAVSALLLTLGGPFWFTVLKDLLRLRSSAASQMNVIRKPCSPKNFMPGRPGGLHPAAIVIHISEGTLASADAWFNNDAAVVSAHYIVGRSGEVHQYVSEEDTAYHAGSPVNPTWRLLRPHVNPNSYTVGVEHEGRAQDQWTDEQYATSAELVGEIARRWSIPIDADHIVLHREIRANKTCPGFVFSRDKLLSLIAALTCPS